MRTSSKAGRKFSAADRTDSVERLGAFLRARHPVKTASNVAADTGVNADTVQKWLDSGCAPSWAAAMALLLAYGAEPFCAALGHDTPTWLTTAGQDAELARMQAEREALDARIASLRNR
jgi:DNA-binding phage protein